MKLKYSLKEYRGLFLFAVLIICLRSAVADWNYVPSGSMEPTILPGDELFVNKMAYDIRLPLTSISLWRHAEPAPGDIVTFQSQAADKRMVKRVIGLPGDEISLYQNRLFVNGLPASYSNPQMHDTTLILTEAFDDVQHTVQIQWNGGLPQQSFSPMLVPEGFLLVLGDNRDHSADSRVYGLVPRQELTGKVVRVIASLDIQNHYKPRPDRFFIPLR